MRLITWILVATVLAAAPVTQHTANPHYYEWKGKPLILLTSGEHYGAVLNADFDYRKYLATLAKDGLNLTRIFTGVYREVPGDFGITRNTLAPTEQAYVSPYGKVAAGKYDLTKWNPAYWTRLHSFLDEANRHGIVVEVTIFCVYYQDRMWELSPWHPNNNVNATPAVPRAEVLTLKHDAYVKRQEGFVRKIAAELARHDNVIFEVCNEPYVTSVPADWQTHMAAVAKQSLPNHLVGRNVANFTAKVPEADANISFLNFHYARPPVVVAENYGLGKIIGLDETGFDGTLDAIYRIQAWDFLLAGGAHYNNLDYSFVAGHEDGTFLVPGTAPGGGSVELRKQLGILRRFIDQLPITSMRPVSDLFVGSLPDGWSGRAFGNTERIAVYVQSAQVQPNRRPRITYHTSKGSLSLRLNLPAGRWTLNWWDTRTGKVQTQTLMHEGGHAVIGTPEFTEDLAATLERQ